MAVISQKNNYSLKQFSLLSIMFFLFSFSSLWAQDISGVDESKMDLSNSTRELMKNIKDSDINKEYLIELIEKSRDLKLSEERYWMVLMHYKKKTFNRFESYVDGKFFFNDSEGKYEPQRELEATLKGFFYGDKENPLILHPQCRFTARYRWLKEKLSIEPSKINEFQCTRFEKWKKSLDVESVTLVFSSFYLNNPASMYGHTLLKLNKRRNIKGLDLLDYGLNFAANPGNIDIISYVYFGLLGGFPGYFSIFPYYMKVNEYNDTESRDLWEYHLNLNGDEIEKMMYHIWELLGTYFDYYYFDENCSYQILSALEAARPTLYLSDKFSFIVKPVDTLKLVSEQKELVSSLKYRPSVLSKYKIMYSNLSDKEAELFSDMLSDHILLPDDLTPERKAFIIETFFEFSTYKKYLNEGQVEESEKEYYNKLLLLRSKIDEKPNIEFINTIPENQNPLSGHESTHASANFGYSGRGYFTSLVFAPALRDHIDSPVGYSAYSQLYMFAVGMKYFYEEKKYPQLDYFKLMEVISLSPLNRHIYRPSWKLSFGAKSGYNELLKKEDTDRIYAYFTYGMGPTFESYDWGYLDNFAWYTLIGAELNGGYLFHKGYRAGTVVSSGILWRMTLFWSWKIEANHHWMYPDYKNDWFDFKAKTNIGFNQSFALEAAYEYHLKADNYNEISASVKYYF
ncbi:MAG: DUF4105 domain-containing protein [Spirochaetia bacterium]|nr:DUF4105 domain-containing protein [Spirochaetia bacterium]